MYDPQLCYILDGFLGLYGLIITGMFIKEKVCRLSECLHPSKPLAFKGSNRVFILIHRHRNCLITIHLLFIKENELLSLLYS